MILEAVTMEWKIKKFDQLTVSELYNILKAREEIFIIEQTCIYEDMDGKDRQAYHLFLEDKGEVVSYLRILPKGGRYEEVSLSRVITRAKYRKKGYGKELVKNAIDFVERELKEGEIRISAQTYLEEFYGSFGFKRVSENYLEDDQDHCEMYYSRQ